MIRSHCMILLILGCLTAHAAAQSSAIGFQAKLTGVADGPHTMTFSLYDVETGGTPLQTVGPQEVIVQDGVVSTSIAFDSGHWNGQPRWIGTAINGSTESAFRNAVLRTPFAERVGNLVDSNGNLVIGNGLGTARVGINTTPNALLHIQQFNQHPTGLHVEGRLGNEPSPPVGLITFEDRDQLPYQTGGVAFIEKYGDTNHRLIKAWYEGAVKFDLDNDGDLWIAKEVSASVVQIRGGSDLAEPFSSSSDPEFKPFPGMVMSIDPDNPGALRMATLAYDTRVAGVYSGGKNLPTGMIMGKEGCDLTAPGDDKIPLAMAGRVWVFADDSNGPIAPGDRLTTSGVKPGHAMKATDESRMNGTVIGKAMTGLDPESGMVLVLVNLQ